MTTSAAQVKRLKQLRTVIARLKPKQCNMETWYQGKEKLSKPEIRGTHRCGTTACLAGWAAIMFTPIERPTVNGMWSEEALVPRRWAIRNKLRWAIRNKLRYPPEEVALIKGVQHVVVTYRQLGEWALGPAARRLFIPGEGDAEDYEERVESGLVTDQEWMLQKLDALIARLDRRLQRRR